MFLALPVHLRPSIFGIRILGGRIIVDRPRPAPPEKAPSRGELLAARKKVRDRLDELALSRATQGALYFSQPVTHIPELEKDLAAIEAQLETVK